MTSIYKNRIKVLNTNTTANKPYVIYWMQSAQRSNYNHGLSYAIKEANRLKKQLVVFFCLTADFPEANYRHYYFMLEGLQNVKVGLGKKGISFVIKHTSPDIGIIKIGKDAALIVVDKGYLRLERQWRNIVARAVSCPLIEVETNVVVPISVASDKEEYAARTLRPKLNKVIEDYAVEFKEEVYELCCEKTILPWQSLDISSIEAVLERLNVDASVGQSLVYTGGEREGKRRFSLFLKDKLKDYAELRNNPDLDYTSHMSPYLHFGQISPLYFVEQVKEIQGMGKDAFIEELVIRRELAINYVFFNEKYDDYEGLPNWARETLEAHSVDERPYLYNLEELETSKTHDEYWNVAQKEMVVTGGMQCYMRMYWGKKVLEWSKSPEDAFYTLLYLNNKYCIDGRDPNSFTGVAWCFGKHDRPWKRRAVFGTIRYMNANGLKRKFKMDEYLLKNK